jgi:hypothetical protein
MLGPVSRQLSRSSGGVIHAKLSQEIDWLIDELHDRDMRVVAVADPERGGRV